MEDRELARYMKDSGNSGRGKLKSSLKNSPPRKPWGLVVGIVVVLVGLGIYISWLNSPNKNWPGNLSGTLFNDSETESLPDTPSEQLDSLDLWEKSLLAQTTAVEDSTIEDSSVYEWKDEPEDTPIPASTEVNSRKVAPPVKVPETTKTSPAPPAQNKPLPAPAPRVSPTQGTQTSSKPMYSVVAGEFTNRSDAMARVKELRQGNYPAKLVEPNANNNLYKVRIGRFENSDQARKQAAEIAFILDIKTTVAEMLD